MLTGCDKANDRYKQAEEGFLAALGIPKTRYIGCTNYCDDYAAAKDVSLRQASFPELDVPVIRFMQEVCVDNSVLHGCYCYIQLGYIFMILEIKHYIFKHNINFVQYFSRLDSFRLVNLLLHCIL